MDSGFSCYMTYAKEAFTDYISLDKPIPVRPCFAISIIDAPDYLALSDCTFHTGGEQTLVGGLRADGVQQVIIGPPQPITSVSCKCYDNNNQFIGPCCNGYCAATLCRPWINPSNPSV
ncbi:hypothetical protein GMDG_08221 [Pseudogymnoascus destructans 20631-21]|uniref:Uncharacterized protein n=1 Tax=Pseudogymnoascus destructans (strain ATCC MYA-4855 / 20631-21) TaxID=658429 RepID=L8G1G4_PSED2|nr:hypothetical protein GMDG_08221 [Pseudogymnoascus destructans 20631-21]